MSLLKRCFRRQGTGDMMSHVSTSELKRCLSAFQLVMLGLGAIVGAGIFVLIGAAAGKAAGPAVVLSFVFGSIACAMIGLCYAELSSAMPTSGGAYTYCYVMLGEVIAWLIGYFFIIGNAFTTASVGNGWSGYVVSLLKDFGVHLDPRFVLSTGVPIFSEAGEVIGHGIFNVPSFLIVLFMGYVLYRGIEGSAMLNTIVVLIKMLVLVLFIVLGLQYFNPENWQPFIPENTGVFGEFGVSGIIGGAAMTLIAFNGFDIVAVAGQETKSPRRDMPIGILGSLMIAAVTYALVAIAVTGIVKYTELNVSQPVAAAVDKMNMPWLANVVKFGAVIGLTSVILAMSYAIIRVIYTMTCDGLLPKVFGKCHHKYKTPHIATVVLTVCVAFISATVPLHKLVQLGNFCVISIYAVVCIAALRYRYSATNKICPSKFKCPLMPIIPILAICMCCGLIFGLPNEVYLQVSVFFVVGLVIYLLYGARHSVLNVEK